MKVKNFIPRSFFKKNITLSIFKKNRDGFSLVELLVVIGIIGVLITVSIVSVQRYQRKAADTRIISSMAQVRNIAAMVYNDDGSYNSLCDASYTLNENHPNQSGIRILEEDIKKFSGQDVICYASGPDYCVQSTLITDDNFCIDATGYIGQTDTHCGEDDGSNIKCSAPEGGGGKKK